MAFDAFNVKPTNEGAKMEVNAKQFEVGGKIDNRDPETSARTRIEQIQENLDYMQKVMKKDLNTDEMKVAWLAIQRELEAGIPDWVDSSYRNETTHWNERADLIQGQILSDVEDFVRNRLKKVIETVDDESWTGSVSRDEAGDILEALEKERGGKISQAEIDAFKKQYVHPTLLEEGVRGAREKSNMRAAADEAMNMR